MKRLLLLASLGGIGVGPSNGNRSGTGALTRVTSDATPPYTYPLQVAPTGRYLIDRHARPFFLVGGAAWSLIAQLTDEDADDYMTGRHRLGFNLIMANLIEHRFATNAPANIYGLRPFTGRPFVTPNEAYFAHADHVIRSAAQKGIVVLLDPLYLGFACGNEGWCSDVREASTAELMEWGRFVGNRYRSYNNIMWLIGGDMDPAPVRAKVRAMVDGIRRADPRHLFTAHNARGQMAITPWGRASWLTVNSIYTTGVTDYASALAAYTSVPTRPFFLIESKYDGEGATAQQLRYQSYGTVLSGGFGHVYGGCPMWGFGAPQSLRFCPSSTTWRSQLYNQGAMNMRYLRRLFESRHWPHLVPDRRHELLTTGCGTPGLVDYAPAAYGSDGSSIVAYLPTARSVTVNASRLAGDTLTAWWYDPATGVATRIGTYPRSRSIPFTTPHSGDWVLVLDAAGFRFTAPGRP